MQDRTATDMMGRRQEVVGRWREAVKRVFQIERDLAAAQEEVHLALNACEDAGFTPHRDEVPRRDR